MNARVAAMETSRGLHLMNLAHAAYSFGYAGGAVLTGVLRGAGWGPDWTSVRSRRSGNGNSRQRGGSASQSMSSSKSRWNS